MQDAHDDPPKLQMHGSSNKRPSSTAPKPCQHLCQKNIRIRSSAEVQITRNRLLMSINIAEALICFKHYAAAKHILPASALQLVQYKEGCHVLTLAYSVNQAKQLAYMTTALLLHGCYVCSSTVWTVISSRHISISCSHRIFDNSPCYRGVRI